MYFQRWVRDWFRVVLPHEGVVIGVVVMYLLTDVFQLLDALAQQMNRFGNGVALPRDNEVGAGLAIVTSVLYGGFRVAYFHPFFRKDYREWLQTSPWSLGHKLPLGPVHVVWQDLFVLGVLSLATLRMSPPAPWAVPLLFLLAYVAVAMVPLLFTGESVIAFVIALLAGGMGRWAREPIVVAALLAAVYGFCFLGLRRSLGRVHEWDLTWWNNQELSQIFSKNLANLNETSRKKILGWPHDRISLRRNETPVSFRVGLCVSVLIAWWLYALLHVFARPGFGPAAVPVPWVVSFVLTVPGLVLAGSRTGIYLWGYASPVSLLARLVTFRWIIPGYDKVFIPPICIVTLVLYGPHAVNQLGIPWEYGVPLLMGLMVLVALTMPPGLDEWRLTGQHRIVPAMQTQQNELMES